MDVARRRLDYEDTGLQVWNQVTLNLWAFCSYLLMSSPTCTARSSEQLWDEENWAFYAQWIFFCHDTLEPTRDLLDVLSNVDLVATSVIGGKMLVDWNDNYKGLVTWVRSYVRLTFYFLVLCIMLTAHSS